MSVITGSSDTVIEIQYEQMIQGVHVEKLLLQGGAMIALSRQQIALYKSDFTIFDPLNSPLVDIGNIPPAYHLPEDTRWVQSAKGGFVRLVNRCGLLITPRMIRLYPSAKAALKNEDTLISLHFENQ